MYVRYMKRWLKISDGHHTTPALSVSRNWSDKIWTADYGLRTGYKIWTTIGIKRGLRTADWV